MTLFKRVQSSTGFLSFHENPSQALLEKGEDQKDFGDQSLGTRASTKKTLAPNDNSETGGSPMNQDTTTGKKSNLNPKKVKDNNVGFEDYVQQ